MIGVDVEEIGRMSSGVERRILVDTEREDLAGLDEAGRQLHVATIFAAKEAFYKAHYELDARYLGFDVIAVRVGEMSLSFEVSSGAVGSEVIGRIVGRALVQDGRVIVGVSIGPAGSATGLPSRP
jgi:4'-phosphopantetheinyl transferase EntD